MLVELGDLYFETYGEVDDALSRSHSPAELYREALTLNAEHEGALLGLFELYRFNWRRSRTSPGELLEKLFGARPRSIRGHLARVSSALDNGDLLQAREDLEFLDEVAPGRREVRTERAALAWIEHGEEQARELLDGLVAQDPEDSRPEREVGRHLLELYRFAEGLPFLERAVERNPLDWRAWKELGRALANTGDEERAREALQKAVELAEGRRDAWRDNTLLVLERMAESLVDFETEALSFAWLPDAAFVLRSYLEPFYRDAREELAARYGFTPDPVRIEVFRKWEDFSVRSTGFQGYPALGVCFGPVVTSVSPISELRGQFSWARTSFHEFTHVIHLGLSHNRCPRWITEGLATWEEGTRNPSWWRNMRRDLVDARANDDVIPVRRLNAAFRGPRVLFAYYQGGLLCKMLIRDHGFSPMVRLLEAFDRGADLDGALGEVFGKSPEEIDAEFLRFVDEEIADLSIEPRWSPENTFRRRFRLARNAPEAQAERAEWQDEWCRVAWGFYWQRKLLDAQEALRTAASAGDLPPRGLFLRGELEVADGKVDGAKAAYREGFARGGEDFRARMALAAMLLREASELGEDSDLRFAEAEEHLLAAEAAFPGYDQQAFSAELRLAELYELGDRVPEAMEARQRWLGYNAGNFDLRVRLAEWLAENGRHEESVRYWSEANEVDPFRRHLHLAWGRSLRALGRHEEALREFDVGLGVPLELDGDVPQGALSDAPGGAIVTPGEDREAEGSETDGASGNGEEEAPLTEEERRAMQESRPRPTLDPLGLLQRWQSEEPLLHGLRALTLLDLERVDEAREAMERAFALDPDCEPAREARERLP